MGKTTVDLTEHSKKIKEKLMPIFGLRNILSAGLILFDKLSSEGKIDAVAGAHGIEKPKKRKS